MSGRPLRRKDPLPEVFYLFSTIYNSLSCLVYRGSGRLVAKKCRKGIRFYTDVCSNASILSCWPRSHCGSVTLRTSEHLKIGDLYSRDDLKARFGIVDATINTGIFKPKEQDSIWLFVTKNKTADRVQYQDELIGDDLFMDGQTAGMKDKLLIAHNANHLEILLFYREEKYEHAGASFRYEGRFQYIDHRGIRPAHFHFRRVS
jgi:hypothetical protein